MTEIAENSGSETPEKKRYVEVSPERDRIYAYFQNIDTAFNDDLELFEQNWRAIQDYDFNAQQLREVLYKSVEYLSAYPRTKNREQALFFMKDNISCWRSKALERINEADFRALLSYDLDLQRLDVEPIQDFTRLWLRRYFELLPHQGFNVCAFGLLRLGEFKKAYLPKEAFKNTRIDVLFTSIDEHVEKMGPLELKNTLCGLDHLDIVPNKDLRKKIISRASALMKAQNENTNADPDQQSLSFGQEALMQVFVSAVNLGFELPNGFMKHWGALAIDSLNIVETPSKIYKKSLTRHARILNACAVQFALTGNEHYRELARHFYGRLKPHESKLGDAGKRMVFDACLFFKYPEDPDPKLSEEELECDHDFDCDIVRPANDEHPSLHEDEVRDYLSSLKDIEIAPEDLVIPKIKHKVDLHVIFNGVAIGVEFDGPDHFLTYHDHMQPESARRRMYKPKDIYQARLKEKIAPNVRIIKFPYSAEKLASNQPVPTQEPENKKELYFARVLHHAAQKRPGVCLIRAQFRKGALLKPVRPRQEGGPAQRYEHLSF